MLASTAVVSAPRPATLVALLEALLGRVLRRCGGAGVILRVAPGRALALGECAGELRVVRGRAWLTCRGDAQDHFVCAGSWVHLRAGHGAVIEPFETGRALVVRWVAGGAR